MADFSYNLFAKPKNLTEFSTGSTWLIGLTAEKREHLLARLKPFAETGNIDSQKIENIISEFIEWFIEDYEKREKKECPFDESEIVESVGIVSMNQSGRYAIYSYGKFRFYHIKHKQLISQADDKGQLTEDDTLIANPKNASINESILAIENAPDSETDIRKYHDFSYPFAIIRPEKETTRKVPEPKKSYWLVVILLLIVSIAVLGWLNKSSVSQYLSGLHTIDSTSNQVGQTTDSATEEMSTDDYFEKAEQSFGFAKSFMEAGKNARAIQQLDSAVFYYQKVLQSDPTYKEKIQPQLDEINTRKSVLSGNKGIE